MAGTRIQNHLFCHSSSNNRRVALNNPGGDDTRGNNNARADTNESNEECPTSRVGTRATRSLTVALLFVRMSTTRAKKIFYLADKCEIRKLNHHYIRNYPLKLSGQFKDKVFLHRNKSWHSSWLRGRSCDFHSLKTTMVMVIEVGFSWNYLIS